MITTKRRSASAHRVATKALPKKTTNTAVKKQSSTSIAKNKEGPKKTEERSADAKLAQRALKADEETSGYYELSPTMATALNEELNIIIERFEKVLPTTALNPTQKYVLDKMKNEVCPDFCNALGLNVAKRTLNVHNGLYVKIQFDREVPANTLRSLKKHYNIVQMRAVVNSPTTYLAVMKDFAGFDALIFASKSKIDDFKIITTPCYKFTKCTDNLRYSSFVKSNSNNMTLKDNKEKTTAAQETPQKPADIQKTPQKTAVDQKTPQETAVIQKTSQKIAVVQKTPQKAAAIQKMPEKPRDVQKTAVAQKTTTNNKTSVATSNTQYIASANKDATQKPTNTTEAKEIKVSNGDKNVKPKNNEVSSQDTKDLEINIESQDIAAFLADGIVVDECMGSDDE